MNTRQDIIIVAVDGSEPSRAAVRWAANTADKRGVPLRVVTSFTWPPVLYNEGLMPSRELFYDFEAAAKEITAEARALATEVAAGLEIEETVVEGHPVDVLNGMSGDATMIVMGTRGRGGVPGMVLGSVSAAAVRHADCPVVVVRADSAVTPDNKYGPVVVGVDGSEVSHRATEYAFAEADARGAELVAVHTWMDMAVQTSLSGLAPVQQPWEEVEREQSDALAEWLQPLVEKYPNVAVTQVVTRDRPVRSLAERSEGAQLLIVGSHGRGGFWGMLLGSTSRALLRYASCPLMVVRPEKDR
ncbi:universal stress protein [Corynebacterium halotolerans]|uniref:universal stress protein n=1 Tax=Corynebacterium halotolerans TaxID=225326 RepID=UPI003CE6FB2C